MTTKDSKPTPQPPPLKLSMHDRPREERLAHLRALFPKECYGILPRATKKDNPKGKCSECGGWHGLPAVHLDYIGHATVTDRLLDVDPEWTWEPCAMGPDGLPAFTRARDGAPIGLWIKLTVLGITRLGFGSVEAGAFEPEKQLIGDALRNAAMRFGVALELWSKAELESAALSNGHDGHNPQTGEGRAITPTPPSKPQAPPVRTVDAQMVRPVQTQQVSPQAAQGETWPRRIFEGCVPDHPGVLIPEKIGANWDTWRREIAVKKEGSTSALANISWQQASEGADGGGRFQALKWIVESAIMEKVQAGAPLTEFHKRGAWTLHVMLERIASEVLDGTDGFAPVEDGPSDAEYDARAAAADVPF